MVDPVSAIAMATTAFKAIKKGIEVGREIEDVSGQLGKWFTAVADIKEAEQQSKNPGLFKKIINKQSVEEEALTAIISKKKIEEQESELRTLILYRYGKDTYLDMMKMRKEIREKRQVEVYNKIRKKKQLIESLLVTVVVSLGISVISLFIWLLISIAEV